MTGAPLAVGFPALLAAIAFVPLTSCVSPKVQKQRGRAVEYRTALDTLKPNSSRAELNRLFPSMEKAVSHDCPLDFPHQSFPSGTTPVSTDIGFNLHSIGLPKFPGSPVARNIGTEYHRLDDGLILSVRYEYRHYRLVRPARHIPTGRGGSLTPADIDALVLGRWSAVYRVYPSPRDRVIGKPGLLLETSTCSHQ